MHVRVRRLHRVGHLDVLELAAPDDPLLLVHGQLAPRGEVVRVLLHDDVAATGELRILVADEHRRCGRGPLRVLRAVDEAQQVALVEVLEAVRLVDDVGVTAEAIHDLAAQLEAHVHVMRAHMQEQVARRRGSHVVRAVQCLERVQPLRPGCAEHPVPQQRADAEYGIQVVRRGAERHRPGDPRQVGEQVADDLLAPFSHREHEEERGAGGRGDDLLCDHWIRPSTRVRGARSACHGHASASSACPPLPPAAARNGRPPAGRSLIRPCRRDCR